VQQSRVAAVNKTAPARRGAEAAISSDTSSAVDSGIRSETKITPRQSFQVKCSNLPHEGRASLPHGLRLASVETSRAGRPWFGWPDAPRPGRGEASGRSPFSGRSALAISLPLGFEVRYLWRLINIACFTNEHCVISFFFLQPMPVRDGFPD
jgi:hypothetical protein